MKNLFKKFHSLLLTAAILLTSILFFPPAGTVAEAAGNYYIPKAYRNMTFYAAPDDLPATYATLAVYHKNTQQKPKVSAIKSLKSSDSSVARPYIDKTGKIRVYFFKKPGKAVISFKVGNQTLKSTVTVKPYSNPLKTFKVGKKNFVSKFNTTTEYNYFRTSDLKNQKVSIQAAKNWKISSIEMKYGSGSYKVSSRKTKTNFSKKVTFDGDADYIIITLYHTKTKAYVTLEWNCTKD